MTTNFDDLWQGKKAENERNWLGFAKREGARYPICQQ